MEDLSAPTVYADFCLGGGPMCGDNVTVTFATKVLDHRFNPPLSVSRTALRLIMPRDTAKGAAEFLRQLVDSLEAGVSDPQPNRALN